MFAVGTWVKLGIALAIVTAVVTSIYVWREDIKQAAFDRFYAEQVNEMIKQERATQARIQKQLDLNETILKDSRERSEQLQARIAEIEGILNDPKFKDGPVESGLQSVVDQIRAQERARAAQQKGTKP